MKLFTGALAEIAIAVLTDKGTEKGGGNAMKKIIFTSMVIFIAVSVLSPFYAIGAKKTDFGSNGTFVLPSSLTIIENEAFEGTAVETIVFQECLVSIGSKAFGNIAPLTDVYISETTTYIADSAFSAADDLTIHGVDGSNAEDWAREHELPFVIDDIWHWYMVPNSVRQHNAQINLVYRYIAALLSVICYTVFKYGYYQVRSRRPQDRPELNSIDYCFL